MECTKLGAVAFLQKPFTAEKVRNVLSEVEPYLESDTISTEKYIIKVKELLDIGELKEAFNLLKKALSENVNNGEIKFNLNINRGKALRNHFHLISEGFLTIFIKEIDFVFKLYVV